MPSPLTLGGVVFQDLEVPEKLPLGGAQSLAEHKLPGGTRLADAMGRDDRDPTWTGRFFGSDALSRAQAIDAMRIAGAPVDLTVSSLSYSVQIKTFEWDYAADWNIEYSITLFILVDNTQPGTADDDTDIDSAMASDLSTANAFGATIGDSGVSGALSTLSSAMASVSSFASATRSVIASVTNPLQAAQGVVSSLLSTTDASIITGSVAGMVAGGSNLAATLTSQANAAQLLPNISGLSNVLGRMSKNLTSLNTAGASITQAGSSLEQMAADAYGDETAWVDIAAANGLTDPTLTGVNTILVPPTQSNSDGVYPQ